MKRMEIAILKMIDALELKGELDEKIEELESYITLDMFNSRPTCDVDWLTQNGLEIEKSDYVKYIVKMKKDKLSLFGEPGVELVSRVTTEYNKEVRNKVKSRY